MKCFFPKTQVCAAKAFRAALCRGATLLVRLRQHIYFWFKAFYIYLGAKRVFWILPECEDIASHLFVQYFMCVCFSMHVEWFLLCTTLKLMLHYCTTAYSCATIAKHVATCMCWHTSYCTILQSGSPISVKESYGDLWSWNYISKLIHVEIYLL